MTDYNSYYKQFLLEFDSFSDLFTHVTNTHVKKYKITLEQLAVSLDISTRTLLRIRNGQANCDHELLVKVCKVLDNKFLLHYLDFVLD